MFIIKYYKCRNYGTIQLNIFKVNAKSEVLKETGLFDYEQLPMMIKALKIKSHVMTECSKLDHVKTLNNPID